MQVGIASSMWRGIVDLPFPEYLTWAKGAGAETIEVAAWPRSYSGALTLDAATAVPARVIGLADSDGLVSGAPADVVVLDDNLEIERVLFGGEPSGVV